MSYKLHVLTYFTCVLKIGFIGAVPKQSNYHWECAAEMQSTE